jgi:hypothetical protein
MRPQQLHVQLGVLHLCAQLLQDPAGKTQSSGGRIANLFAHTHTGGAPSCRAMQDRACRTSAATAARGACAAWLLWQWLLGGRATDAITTASSLRRRRCTRDAVAGWPPAAQSAGQQHSAHMWVMLQAHAQDPLQAVPAAMACASTLCEQQFGHARTPHALSTPHEWGVHSPQQCPACA